MKFKNLSKEEINNATKSYLKYYGIIKEVLKGFPVRTLEGLDNDVKKKKTLQDLPARLYPAKSGNKSRARTVDQLEEKLANLKTKSKLKYKERLVKKGLQNRIKKQEKKIQRRTDKKSNKTNETTTLVKKEDAELEIIENENFQFNTLKMPANSEKIKNIFKKRDVEAQLKSTVEREKRLKKLIEVEGKEKIQAIKEKQAWKAALLRSTGHKVKDDLDLLKASVAKKRKKKEHSEKKWKANKDRIEKERVARQAKRTENIQARSKQKKVKKMKKLTKRGRIIPGF